MKTNNFISALVLLFACMMANIDAQAQQRRLSLQEALEHASAGNKELQIQKLEMFYQKERTREIKAMMLPSINFQGGVSHYFDRQVNFLPGTFAGTQKDVQDVAVGGLNALNASVSLSQPILSESVRRQRKAAVLEETMQQERTADFEAELRYAVTFAYFEMVVLQKELHLQQSSLSRSTKELDDSRALFAQGRALKSDTLRSFIAAENTKSVISQIKSSLSMSGLRLKRLIGIDENEDITPADGLVSEKDFEEFEALQLQYLTANSLSRPDLRWQQLSVEHQQSLLRAIQGAKLPQLSLVGQYQLQAQNDDLDLNQYVYPQTSFLGLQLSIPVFNGKKLAYQSNQAKIRIEQEKLRLADLTDQARLEIAAIFSSWEDASTKLAVQQKTIEAADLHYSMINNRYKNGLSSKLELSDAEVSLTIAQLNHLRNLFEIKLLVVELKKAMGKL